MLVTEERRLRESLRAKNTVMKPSKLTAVILGTFFSCMFFILPLGATLSPGIAGGDMSIQDSFDQSVDSTQISEESNSLSADSSQNNLSSVWGILIVILVIAVTLLVIFALLPKNG